MRWKHSCVPTTTSQGFKQVWLKPHITERSRWRKWIVLLVTQLWEKSLYIHNHHRAHDAAVWKKLCHFLDCGDTQFKFLLKFVYLKTSREYEKVYAGKTFRVEGRNQCVISLDEKRLREDFADNLRMACILNLISHVYSLFKKCSFGHLNGTNNPNSWGHLN